MDLYQFRELDQEDQAQTAWEYGEHIATRITLLHTVSLWQIEGFYVEIFYIKYRRVVHHIGFSESIDILDPYLDSITIGNIFEADQ